jgi:hypothetical protein
MALHTAVRLLKHFKLSKKICILRINNELDHCELVTKLYRFLSSKRSDPILDPDTENDVDPTGSGRLLIFTNFFLTKDYTYFVTPRLTIF